jgi:hypothetical protein
MLDQVWSATPLEAFLPLGRPFAELVSPVQGLGRRIDCNGIDLAMLKYRVLHLGSRLGAVLEPAANLVGSNPEPRAHQQSLQAMPTSYRRP